MNTSALALATVAVATVAALTGCGDSGTDQSSTTTTVTVTATATAAEHNQADVMFAQTMIPHHAQAIEMSDVLLAKQGIDPRVTELATRIKAAQGPEIEQMQGWLTQWGEPTMPMGTAIPGMPMGTTGMGMPGHDLPMPTTGAGTTPGMPMPGGSGMGMMSEQDMTALQTAEGVDAARLFLTQMITHHQGAITMAQTEIETGQNPDAIALARSIAETQQQEITTMQNLLASL